MTYNNDYAIHFNFLVLIKLLSLFEERDVYNVTVSITNMTRPSLLVMSVNNRL